VRLRRALFAGWESMGGWYSRNGGKVKREEKDDPRIPSLKIQLALGMEAKCRMTSFARRTRFFYKHPFSSSVMSCHCDMDD